MKGTRIVLGGLLAIGALALSTSSAQAQYITQYGSYVAPSGGIVVNRAFANPYTGSSVYNHQYYNPYTGYAAQRQVYVPGPVFAPVIYPSFGYRGYGNGGYGGYGGYGGFGNYIRPGFGFGFR